MLGKWNGMHFVVNRFGCYFNEKEFQPRNASENSNLDGIILRVVCGCKEKLDGIFAGEFLKGLDFCQDFSVL